ncbi:MAG: hypothetical protein KIT16_02415 [Rhodospirillaceae bacterium]|nr:hypothetical protein [Rhodospirillaceae bacterium]
MGGVLVLGVAYRTLSWDAFVNSAEQAVLASGTSLFIMRGIAPPGATMAEVIRSGLPYTACDVALLVLLVAAPASPSTFPA